MTDQLLTATQPETEPVPPSRLRPSATNSDGRGRILAEARALFTARGYAVVSMQQIADAVGINKATLYHYFRDKEDLFVAVMRKEFDRIRDGITAALAAGGTLGQQLRRVAGYMFETTQSDLGRLTTDLREHVSPERRDALLQESLLPWEVIGPAIAQAIERGEVRPVDPVRSAEFFSSMIWGQIGLARLRNRWATLDDQLAAAIVDTLLDGIGTGIAATS